MADPDSIGSTGREPQKRSPRPRCGSQEKEVPQMKRNLISALAGLAVLAAAFAPAAVASPVLTEGGVALNPGAAISATNVGNLIRTSTFGNFICTGSTLRMNVLANTGTTIEAEVESATFTGTETEG